MAPPHDTDYPKVRLGGANGPLVSAIGFGAMGIGATMYGAANEQKALDTLTRAADHGVTFWDTSDAYGASQATLGKWFTTTGRRKDVFLATKFGSIDSTKPERSMEWYNLNSKPSYIKAKIAEALEALQTDYIDLYYQHRVDSEVPTEVVMETFRPYLEAGTLKWIGISEASIDVLKRAKAVPGVGEKVIAVQMEYSPFELEIEHSGLLKVAKELDISIVAYSPLGRGVMTGQYKSRSDFEESDIRQFLPRFSDENFPANLKLVDKFTAVAVKHNATPGQATLAWILARYPDFQIVSIPGTRNVSRLEENAAAAYLKLDDEDLKALNEAVNAADVQGDRYPPQFEFLMNRDCIPLSQWKGE